MEVTTVHLLINLIQLLLLIFTALLWLFAWPQRMDSSILLLLSSIYQQPEDSIEILSHRHLSNHSDEMP